MTDIPQTALRARQMYVEREAVDDILIETKLCLKEFYLWLDGAPQLDGTTLLPPIQRRHVFKKRSPGSARERVKLIGRLMRAAERHVKDIEDRLEIAGIAPTERESDRRALAVLARTLRELTALDDLNRKRKKRGEADRKNDEPIPRDIDEIRRSLSRKLEALVAEQQGALPETHHGPAGQARG
jgi:hypothetical protein